MCNNSLRIVSRYAGIHGSIRLRTRSEGGAEGVATATLMRICDPFCHALYDIRGPVAAQELSKVCSKRVGEVTRVEGRRVRPEFAYYFYVATKGRRDFPPYLGKIFSSSRLRLTCY